MFIMKYLNHVKSKLVLNLEQNILVDIFNEEIVDNADEVKKKKVLTESIYKFECTIVNCHRLYLSTTTAAIEVMSNSC